MPNAQEVLNQIDKITWKLVELSLCKDQKKSVYKNGEIIYFGKTDIAIALKDIAYEKIYQQLDETKNYTLKMLDGGLIQMLYTYSGKELISHRLAFFPNPQLESFQNNPNSYTKSEVYADMIAKNRVTFPIRFDYDPNNFLDCEHPKTHATLGQYKNCRIPVSEPLTPEIFISFILRNFYNTAYHQFTKEFTLSQHHFPQTISRNEKKLLHFSIY